MLIIVQTNQTRDKTLADPISFKTFFGCTGNAALTQRLSIAATELQTRYMTDWSEVLRKGLSIAVFPPSPHSLFQRRSAFPLYYVRTRVYLA